MTRVTLTLPRRLDPPVHADIVRCVREGGVIVAPTDTVYGLFCNALDPQAVERVCAIKGREPGRAMPVAVAGEREAGLLVRDVSEAARRLMGQFWPGALTIVLRAVAELPAAVAPEGTVGVRAPGHDWLLSLLKDAALPLVATSANLSGGPQPVSLDVVPPDVLEAADFVVDQGELPAGKPSSVLDLTGPQPRLLREGVLSREELSVALGAPIL